MARVNLNQIRQDVARAQAKNRPVTFRSATLKGAKGGDGAKKVVRSSYEMTRGEQRKASSRAGLPLNRTTSRPVDQSRTSTVTTTHQAPPVAPFLTPAQQKALSDWNTRYGLALGKLDNADSLALSKFTMNYGADQFKNANQQDMTNQSMAARGLGQSSIRDNALNDLAATLAQQYNVLHTNYQTTLLNNATNRGILQGEDANEQSFAGEEAVQNAQSIQPNAQTTTTTQTIANPAQAGAGRTGAVVTNNAARTDAHQDRIQAQAEARQDRIQARQTSRSIGGAGMRIGPPGATNGATRVAGARSAPRVGVPRGGPPTVRVGVPR